MAAAYDPEEMDTLIADIVKREEKLTAWEHDFIVSIKTQIEAGRTLSLKQAGIVQEIWDKVT